MLKKLPITNTEPQALARLIAAEVYHCADTKTKADFPKGTKVFGSGVYKDKFCLTTGHFRRCGLAGCSGLAMRAQWSADPKTAIKTAVVWLCVKGLTKGRGKSWRIS